MTIVVLCFISFIYLYFLLAYLITSLTFLTLKKIDDLNFKNLILCRWSCKSL